MITGSYIWSGREPDESVKTMRVSATPIAVLDAEFLTDWIALKMYSHFVSYVKFCSTEDDTSHNKAALHVANPIITIPCLLILWRL